MTQDSLPATDTPARAIRFWFRGQVVNVSGISPTRSVLQWLREDQGATGSKEGCAEGDCGACTVVVGSRDDTAPGGLRLQAVNSCIQFVPTLDGKALFTVEDLADNAGPGNQLHPVQQAMVEHHGSQCGFCTPGFVMSMWAQYENCDSAPDRAAVTDCLSGNLCRCTGYRPIIDAAQAAWHKPVVKMEREPVRAALDVLALSPALKFEHAGHSFHAPRTADELGALLAANPDARLLAGSTDVGLWVNKQMRELPQLIYVGNVQELHSLREHDGMLEIGAAVSLTDAFAALVKSEPAWAEMARRFASVPVRNAGTLGGNVANGSPIGDSMPGLIALGTRVVLQRGSELRAQLRELLLEDLYLDYQKTALQPGEFLRSLLVPTAVPGRLFRTWKISKRTDQDISAVCAAVALTFHDGAVLNARIAFGGMAATPKRAVRAEAELQGHVLSVERVRAAMAALQVDYQPLSDMRASAAYRMQTAQNMLWRLWLEQSGSDVLRVDDVSAIAAIGEVQA